MLKAAEIVMKIQDSSLEQVINDSEISSAAEANDKNINTGGGQSERVDSKNVAVTKEEQKSEVKAPQTL